MSITERYGIDYSLGMSNFDRSTGIHYGVISQHSVSPYVFDSDVEYEYPDPCCECGCTLIEAPNDDDYYVCESCHNVYTKDSCVFDEMEPIGWNISEEKVDAHNCLDSDVIVTRSEYFTYAKYCSPCVPGACSLDSPVDNPQQGDPRCFCLPKEWFDNDAVPYDVYSVKTGELLYKAVAES